MANSSDRAVRKHLKIAALAALSKKAAGLVVLDVRKLSGFTDYFLICQGGNTKQVQAIAEAVDERLDGDAGLRPEHREGFEHAEWVVLDYVDFVVHVFVPASRQFYGLERLWSKAGKLDLKLEQPA